MITFPSLPIPAQTMKRSFALEQAHDLQHGLDWVKLLAKIAPRKAAKLNALNAMECYEAVVAELGTMMPLFESVLDDWEEYEEGSMACRAWNTGIPLDVRGFSYDLYYYGRSPALSLAYFYTETLSDWSNLSVTVENRLRAFEQGHDLKKHKATLMPYIESWPLENAKNGGMQKFWKGRNWVAPWDGLLDLIQYVSGSTDFDLLNVTHQSIAETGDDYPTWDIEHVRYFAKEWKKAEPTFDRIMNLASYIDAKPETRLVQLAALLSGEVEVADRVSTRKRKRVKYLKDILK